MKKNTNVLKNIKCSEDSPNCLSIISTGVNGNENQESNIDKVLVVGGLQCMYFISIKYKALIYKLFLPNVAYFRTILNTGYKFYNNSIVCCGLFNSYSNDIVTYNIINQGGYNKFNLLEKFRICEADKSPIIIFIFL